MKIPNTLLSGVAAALVLALAGPATAQDCPRGDLDKRYCDVGGDLVADRPADLVDPETLIFAFTPVDDPAVYKSAFVTEYGFFAGHDCAKPNALSGIQPDYALERP